MKIQKKRDDDCFFKKMKNMKYEKRLKYTRWLYLAASIVVVFFFHPILRNS